MNVNFFRRGVYALIYEKMADLVRYSDGVQYYTLGDTDGDILGRLIERHARSFTKADFSGGFPTGSRRPSEMRLHILNGVFNSSDDIQGLLEEMKKGLSRRDRVLVVLYNPYLKWFYRLLDIMGIRQGPRANTFITETDLRNIAVISGFQVVRTCFACGFWLRLFGIGRILDRVIRLIPGLKRISLVYLARAETRHSRTCEARVVGGAFRLVMNAETSLKRSDA